MKKILPLSLLAALCAQSAHAGTVQDNKGYIAGSHLGGLFRNGDSKREYKGEGVRDRDG